MGEVGEEKGVCGCGWIMMQQLNEIWLHFDLFVFRNMR